MDNDGFGALLGTQTKPEAELQRVPPTWWPEAPSLDNYRHVLLDTSFPTWFLNSVIVSAFTMVIGIKQSYDPKLGWVEVYYNGQQQKLSDGSMRATPKSVAAHTALACTTSRVRWRSACG
mgnify:CR=1 FL=1